MAKAYADEKDPYVLKSIAQYAASSANDSQELGNLFKSMLKNDKAHPMPSKSKASSTPSLP